MRKSIRRLSLALAAFAPLAGPAQAQTAEEIDAKMAERLLSAGDAYRAEPEQPACPGGTEGGDNDIVVCAREDSADWRVRSSRELDPLSREALRDGLPRAPQLDRGSCKGKGKPGCMVGGWAPPPVYFIDLKAIPEAPAGSDADKVARGEMADR